MKHLILSDNQISDEGCISLLNNLKNNKTLQSLFIADNPIGDKSIKTLVELLNNSPTQLKIIDCRGCKVKDTEIIKRVLSVAKEKGITIYQDQLTQIES